VKFLRVLIRKKKGKKLFKLVRLHIQISKLIGRVVTILLLERMTSA